MKKFITLFGLIILASIGLTSCGNNGKDNHDKNDDKNWDKTHLRGEGIYNKQYVTYKINQTYKDGCNKRTRKNCAEECATNSVCENVNNSKLTDDANVEFWWSCEASFNDTVKKLAKNNSPQQLCHAAGPLGKASATVTGFTSIVGSIKSKDKNLNNAAKDIGLSDSDLANIKTSLRSCAQLYFCGTLKLNK